MVRLTCCGLILAVGLGGWLSQPVELTGQDPPSLAQQAKKLLAQLDGKVTIAGLKEPVEVKRDQWGIAHIYARNQHDLFFAQGFVAAQDRLFQMDWWRRVALGETAYVLGQDGVEGDRFARTLLYRGDMDAEWKSYSPDTKEIARAFTDGINAYIDHVGDKLPIEFQLLNYKPAHWHARDVLGRMSGVYMTLNFEREIFRAMLVSAVGVEKARQLAPTDPVTAFAPAPELELKYINMKILSKYKSATKALAFKPSTTQSNNWVVTGTRSASGKPMLASDPHRALALPSLRYLVHLHAPGWNVIGAGEPGLPGVAIGHNEHIAWGFTIVGTDQADLYAYETRGFIVDIEYNAGGTWKKFKRVKEYIRVKGQDKSVEHEVLLTDDGPVIFGGAPFEKYAIVLKWVGNEPGGAAYLGSLAVARAKNRNEFLSALKSWKSPHLNFVYADKNGEIGWIAAGLTPVREGYHGLLPVPGGGKYQWKSVLEVKDYPQEFNPQRGFVATANHNILPKDYPHQIAYDWDPGYRFQVIKQRLEAKDKFTLDDFKSIQHETTSLPGQALVKLAQLLKNEPKKVMEYAKVMQTWDGVLSSDAQAGPIYAAWLRELHKQFYEKRLPPALRPHLNFLSVKVMLEALEKPDAKWFDKGEPTLARYGLVRSSFSAAISNLEKQLGVEAAPTTTWGQLHTASFKHPLSGLSLGHAKAFDLGPVERSGDAYTPNNTRFDDKFKQIHGASYRHLFDLSDWDKGIATSTPGQSGQPGSPHYGDLLPLWGKGEYFPLAYSEKKVEEVMRHQLVLTPKAGAN